MLKDLDICHEILDIGEVHNVGYNVNFAYIFSLVPVLVLGQLLSIERVDDNIVGIRRKKSTAFVIDTTL